MNDQRQVYLVSLGCSKNLVDSESMMDILSDSGYSATKDPAEADVIVVNTCGFIKGAKEEAINTILDMADYKRGSPQAQEGKCEYLIVTGCLSQRYYKEIQESLPEVDAILGTFEYGSIARTIDELYESGGLKADSPEEFCQPLVRVGRDKGMVHLSADRNPSTRGFAYLKVAEGCSNNCSYCAIPAIRGRMVSRPLEDLYREAKNLADKGFYELVLIAQDTTNYGLDLYGERRLTELINKISQIDGIRKIRLLYCYVDGITDELIEIMASNTKVAKYIDIPIQHISDSILKKMKRKDTSSTIRQAISKLRAKIPGITIRTTVIVGFPTEKQEDFDQLYSFLQEVKFDLLGCFVFSPEEGTPAYKLSPRVKEEVANERYDKIMDLQKSISRERNQAFMGKELQVTIDSIADDGIFYLGRGDGQAPEIDPPISVIGSHASLEIGREYTIKIVDYSDYDLTGVSTHESSE